MGISVKVIFVDRYQLPVGVSKGTINMGLSDFAYSASIYDPAGTRLYRSRITRGEDVGPLMFDVPDGATVLVIEDKNPRLKQVFSSYEIILE